jgi:hypothetical protein
LALSNDLRRFVAVVAPDAVERRLNRFDRAFQKLEEIPVAVNEQAGDTAKDNWRADR